MPDLADEWDGGCDGRLCHKGARFSGACAQRSLGAHGWQRHRLPSPKSRNKMVNLEFKFLLHLLFIINCFFGSIGFLICLSVFLFVLVIMMGFVFSEFFDYHMFYCDFVRFYFDYVLLFGLL